jgi:hypothetical protein
MAVQKHADTKPPGAVIVEVFFTLLAPASHLRLVMGEGLVYITSAKAAVSVSRIKQSQTAGIYTMTAPDPRRTRRRYDTFPMGRSGMDLNSNDVGADFVHIRGFSAYVDGSPTNMSVGCRRLGLKSVLLTAFVEDPVGDFSVLFLRNG